MLQAASQGRLQAPVERVIDGVLIPFLNFLYAMVKERMPVKEIREILGDQMTEDLVVDLNDFFNADIKFDTLAGTRLAARTRMAQALPFLLEVFGNQALVTQMGQTGWKVNVMEMVAMVMDVSEWKNKRNLVVPMTDQEKQSMAQQNPAMVKARRPIRNCYSRSTRTIWSFKTRKTKRRIASQRASTIAAGKKCSLNLRWNVRPASRSASPTSARIQGSQFYGSSPGSAKTLSVVQAVVIPGDVNNVRPASAHFTCSITPRHQRLAALDAQRKVDHLGGIGWKALIDDDEAFDAEMLFLLALMRGLIEDLSKTDLGPAGGRLFVRITPLGRVCSAGCDAQGPAHHDRSGDEEVCGRSFPHYRP